MYQTAQKESHYNFNPAAPAPSYLRPHEMYPSAFPYQMMYQQYAKPAFSYSLSAEQKELYLPKTLPQSNSTNNTTRSLEPRSLEGQKMHETFEVWNNSLAREMKSIPKFDSLLDIDRLEQLCYDEVDNISANSGATIERPKEDRGYKQKEEKYFPSAIKDLPNGNISRTPEKVAVGSLKNTNVQTSGSSPNGARPKEATLFNGRPNFQNKNAMKVA